MHEALSDQVCMLKQQCQSASGSMNMKNKKSSSPKLGKSISSYISVAASAPVQASLTPATTITVQYVVSVIHNIDVRRICDNTVNIESDIRYESPVRPRRRCNFLVGNNMETDGCIFKAPHPSSTKLHYFYVTNLDAGQLCSYLQNFALNVTEEKLNIKNPLKYSSFKLCVLEGESRNILVNNI